jgi:hypothetical protein
MILNCIRVYTWLPAGSPVLSLCLLEPSRRFDTFPFPLSFPQGCRYRLATLWEKGSGRCPERGFLLCIVLRLKYSSTDKRSENIALGRRQPGKERSPEEAGTVVEPRGSRVWWSTKFRFGLSLKFTFRSS